MSLLDILANPGAAVGCVVGIALSAGLHWLFPREDLVTVQAILVVACTAIGMVLEVGRTDGGD